VAENEIFAFWLKKDSYEKEGSLFEIDVRMLLQNIETGKYEPFNPDSSQGIKSYTTFYKPINNSNRTVYVMVGNVSQLGIEEVTEIHLRIELHAMGDEESFYNKNITFFKAD
jgi:hypothetical protein